MFKEWETADKENVRFIQEKLTRAKAFYRLGLIPILRVYRHAILDELEDFVKPKTNKKDNPLSCYRQIGKLIIEAHQHVDLSLLLVQVLDLIRSHEEDSEEVISRLIIEFKKALDQLKLDHDYYAVSIEQEIDISQLSSSIKPTIKHINLSFTNKQFMEEMNHLLNPILLASCDSLPLEMKKECERLIEDLNQLIKSETIDQHKSEELRNRCLLYISKLYLKEGSILTINKNNGPVLNVLYCVAGLCQVGMPNVGNLAEQLNYLNEGIYHATESLSPLKDYLHLIRAYLRLDHKRIENAEYDLNNVTNESLTNLKNTLSNDIITYKGGDSLTNLKNNKEIEKILSNISTLLFADETNFDEVFYLQEKYITFLENEIPLHQQVQYHFLMTIAFIKIKVESFLQKNNFKPFTFDVSLLDHLQNALTYSNDLVITLSQFMEKIVQLYPAMGKDNIKFFYNMIKHIRNPNNAISFNSLVFTQKVSDYQKTVVTTEINVEAVKKQNEDKTNQLKEANDFLLEIKASAKNDLYLINMTYPDAKFTQILDEFYQLENTNIKEFEAKCSLYLQEIFKRGERPYHKETGNLRPFASALFFLIGACKFAQGKFMAAEINFEEAVFFNPGYMAFESVLYLLIEYSLFSSQVSAEKLNKISEYHKQVRKNLDGFENPTLTTFYNRIDEKLNAKPKEETPKHEIENVKALYNLVAVEKNKQKSLKLLSTLKQHKHFNCLSKQNILEAYTLDILYEIEALVDLKTQGKEITIDKYRHVGNLLIKAHDQIKFCYLIINIIDEIDNTEGVININAYAEACEFKKVLDQLKADHEEYTSSLTEHLVDLLIQEVSPSLDLKPSKITMQHQVFIDETCNLAKPTLIKLCESFPRKIKQECLTFLNRLNQINSNKTNYPLKYTELRTDCTKFLANLLKEGREILNINKNNGPVLDFLYFIASICQIGIYGICKENKVKLVGLNEVDLNEGLYHSSQSQSGLKDFFHIIRAYQRLQHQCISGAIYDLDDNKISNESLFKLKETLKNDINIQIENNQGICITDNPDAEILLTNLKQYVLERKYESPSAIDTPDEMKKICDFENQFHDLVDQNKISLNQQAEYYFWITVLSFKLHAAALAAKTNEYIPYAFDSSLLNHLENALVKTNDLIPTLLRFKEIISSLYPEDKNQVKIFFDLVKSISGNNENFRFDSQVFTQKVNDFCKEATKNKKSKAETKSRTAKPTKKSVTSEKSVSLEKQAKKDLYLETSQARADENAKQIMKEENERLAEKKRIADEKLKEDEAKRIAQENRKKQEAELKIKADEEKRIEEEENKRIADENKKIADEMRAVKAERKTVKNEKRQLEIEAKKLAEEKVELAEILKQLADEKIKTEMEAKRYAQEKQKLEDEVWAIKKELAKEERASKDDLEVARKADERLMQIKKDYAILDKNLETARHKVRDKKLRAQRKKTTIISDFFGKEVSLLNDLNALDKMELDKNQYGSVIFKGSFVIKWYFLSLGDIDASDAVNIKDIDAYIECSDFLSQINLAEKLKALKGFSEEMRGNGYINLKKKMSNGIDFDLTLKLKNENPNTDFIPVTRGEACILAAEGKTPKLKVHNPNKAFQNACLHRAITFDKPILGMTSCAFRIAKTIKRKNIFAITNLSETLVELNNVYEASYTIKTSDGIDHKNDIYLELRDFVKHNYVDDVDATDLLRLIFSALLKKDTTMLSDEGLNGLLNLFSYCQTVLHHENKKSFIKQIHSMMLLYTKGNSFDDIKDKLLQMKIAAINKMRLATASKIGTQFDPEFSKAPANQEFLRTHANAQRKKGYIHSSTPHFFARSNQRSVHHHSNTPHFFARSNQRSNQRNVHHHPRVQTFAPIIIQPYHPSMSFPSYSPYYSPHAIFPNPLAQSTPLFFTQAVQQETPSQGSPLLSTDSSSDLMNSQPPSSFYTGKRS